MCLRVCVCVCLCICVWEFFSSLRGWKMLVGENIFQHLKIRRFSVWKYIILFENISFYYQKIHRLLWLTIYIWFYYLKINHFSIWKYIILFKVLAFYYLKTHHFIYSHIQFLQYNTIFTLCPNNWMYELRLNKPTVWPSEPYRYNSDEN